MSNSVSNFLSDTINQEMKIVKGNFMNRNSEIPKVDVFLKNLTQLTYLEIVEEEVNVDWKKWSKRNKVALIIFDNIFFFIYEVFTVGTLRLYDFHSIKRFM